MALSVAVKLGAGAKLYYEAVPSGGGAATYVELPNALVIGPVGAQGSFVDVTPIAKITEEVIRGRATTPELSMEFNHQPGLPAYAAFLVLARDRDVDSMNLRIDYATGDRCELVAIPNGVQMSSPEGNTQQKTTVFLKQSGDETWTEVA